MHKHLLNWDPDNLIDKGPIEKFSLLRIRKDLEQIMRDPSPGIFLEPEDDNLCRMHALIIGPKDTPYQGGYFHFVIGFPNEYPIVPPKVKLMTTGNGSVRFNPNLYANGMVCLSILGTFSGPEWSAAQCVGSILLSIQSLMSENPYYNEPGSSKRRDSKESTKYNQLITYQTLRLAVCDILEKKCTLPEKLYENARNSFFEHYDYYVGVCERNLQDTREFKDPFRTEVRPGFFNYKVILDRLKAIRVEIGEKVVPLPPPSKELSNDIIDDDSVSLTTNSDDEEEQKENEKMETETHDSNSV